VRVVGEREGRLAAIGGVTSAIVHDVHNPLSAILSISQGVEHDARQAGQAELAEDMQAVVASGRRLQGLFEQVQAFARAEGPPLQQERVGVSDLVTSSLAALAPPLRGQGITLELGRGGAGAAAVLVDRAALRRVLEQLVRNAARAISDRRTAGAVVDGRIRVEPALVGRRLRLRVLDDGCGLDPAVRARLFHPFVAAGRTAGPGLGLAVARSLVRAQGGELSAEPEPPPGGGAAFVVELPLAPGA
jgi:signal transduction histidine kinase